MMSLVKMLDVVEESVLKSLYRFLKYFETTEAIRFISVEEMNKFLKRKDIMIFKKDALYFPSQIQITKDDIEKMYWIEIENNELKGFLKTFNAVDCFEYIK